MAAKHTPGTWNVSHVSDPYDCYQVDTGDDGYIVAECIDNGHDAILIAAAPDMFEALPDLLAEVEAWRAGLNNRSMNKCKVGAKFANIEKARAAIAKARGEG